jgi:hypothetical protein
VNRIIRIVAVAVLALAIGGAVISAQEGNATQTASAQKPAQIPLKVQLVLSRYRGEKKIASFPYQLWVTTNERTTNLRMGLQVPVATTTFGSVGNNTTPISSYSMKDVSTNIDCSATTGLENGVYKLSVTVNDTSVLPREDLKAEPGQVIAPAFRSFTSSFVILLRDGQTAQYTTATDPVTGEVLKIDATLTVLR